MFSYEQRKTCVMLRFVDFVIGTSCSPDISNARDLTQMKILNYAPRQNMS